MNKINLKELPSRVQKEAIDRVSGVLGFECSELIENFLIDQDIFNVMVNYWLESVTRLAVTMKNVEKLSRMFPKFAEKFPQEDFNRIIDKILADEDVSGFRKVDYAKTISNVFYIQFKNFSLPQKVFDKYIISLLNKDDEDSVRILSNMFPLLAKKSPQSKYDKFTRFRDYNNFNQINKKTFIEKILGK